MICYYFCNTTRSFRLWFVRYLPFLFHSMYKILWFINHVKKSCTLGTVNVLPVFLSFHLSLAFGCWSCSEALSLGFNVYTWNSFKFSKWNFSVSNVFRHIFTCFHFSTWTCIYSYDNQKESSSFLIICWSFVKYLSIQGSKAKER